MALALKDRVKETTIVVGTGTATLLGSSIGFQPFSVVGNGNTTYYCISDQFGSNWEVGIGTYSSSGNTLTRTTVLASSNGGALVVFTAGIKDVFVTYPAEKGVWLDASGNAIGLGTPAAFVGTNITGTASGLTAGNVTTNANLTGAVTSSGNATSLGSFTSAQLALAISDETGTGKAVFATNPTLTSPTYAGTLTGSTDILNIGSGQVYKDASGNVGIGTSSPATKLHLLTPSAANVELRIGNSLSYSSLLIDSAGDSRLYTPALNQIFSVNSAERMRIDSSGNVGIGCTPQAKFEIQGASAANCLRLRTTASSVEPTAYYDIGRDGDGYLKFNGAQTTFVGYKFFNTGSEVLRIDSSGNLLVNTTVTPTYGLFTGTTKNGSPNIRWEWGPSIVNGVYYVIPAGGGSGVYLTSGNTSWSSNSDLRLKNVTGTYENALNDIVQIEPIKFTWKADSSNKPQVGLSAQSVQKVIPEAVDTEALSIVGDNEEKYLSVRYTEVIPLLVASIKELKAIIDTQQLQINSLLGK